MKVYESPMAEFVEFKNDKILTGSIGCNCYYGNVSGNVDPGDPSGECESVTAGMEEWQIDADSPIFSA